LGLNANASKQPSKQVIAQFFEPGVQVGEEPSGALQEDGVGSVFSDSLEEIPDDEVLLKQMQKQRFKRKQGRHNFNPLGTPKFVQVAEMVRQGKGGGRQGSIILSKSSNKERNKENSLYTTVSQQAQVYGGIAHIPSGINLILEDNEVVLETQLEGEVNLKELAATKVLLRQKEAGFSHVVADDPITGRLVKIEEVDVKKKMNRGMRLSDQ